MADVMFSCRKLPEKFGKLLSDDQLKQIEELGLLADLDDQVGLVPNTSAACSSACHGTLSAYFRLAGLPTTGLFPSQGPSVLGS